MPNWCDTEYYFISKDKDVLEDFRSRLSKATSNSSFMKEKYGKSDFGDGWLGNVLHEFCLSREKVVDDCVNYEYNGTVRFRGSIVSLDDEIATTDDGRYILFLVTETAWGPMTKMWDAVIEDNYPGQITYVFHASEPGMEYYVTNDAEREWFNEYEIEGAFDILDTLYDPNDPESCRSDDVIGPCDSVEDMIKSLQDLIIGLKRIERMYPALFKVHADDVFADVDFSSVEDWNSVSMKFNKIFEGLDLKLLEDIVFEKIPDLPHEPLYCINYIQICHYDIIDPSSDIE